MDYRNDPEFEEHIIERVGPLSRGYREVTFDGSTCVGVPDDGFVPVAGQRIRLFGRGLGFPVRGIVIDRHVCYYRTPEQHRAWEDERLRAARAERGAEYERDRATRDARRAALPEVFRRRLDRFSVGSPDFRVDYEPYELFVCEQAVVIAEGLALVGQSIEVVSGRLNRWQSMALESQRTCVPGLSDAHSGNTFGMACRLAYWYATQPENVVREHGAMVSLTGCEAYGCTHE